MVLKKTSGSFKTYWMFTSGFAKLSMKQMQRLIRMLVAMARAGQSFNPEKMLIRQHRPQDFQARSMST